MFWCISKPANTTVTSPISRNPLVGFSSRKQCSKKHRRTVTLICEILRGLFFSVTNNFVSLYEVRLWDRKQRYDRAGENYTRRPLYYTIRRIFTLTRLNQLCIKYDLLKSMSIGADTYANRHSRPHIHSCKKVDDARICFNCADFFFFFFLKKHTLCQ